MDIENEIITVVMKSFKENKDFKDIPIISDSDITPTTFPCIYFYQADSYDSSDKHTASREEKGNIVLFEAFVYSNTANKAKSECKNIFKVLNDVMRIEGFHKMTETPLTPQANTVKAIRFARYKAEASADTYMDGKQKRHYIYYV